MQGRRPGKPLGTGASPGRLRQAKNVKYGTEILPRGAVIERFNHLVWARYNAHARRNAGRDDGGKKIGEENLAVNYLLMRARLAEIASSVSFSYIKSSS